MPALGTVAQGVTLNYILGGATQPANSVGTSAVELSGGAPTSVSASPIAAASIASRQPASFGSVAPGASASNNLAMTFSAISAATVSGLTIWNTAGAQAGGGTMWCYGLLATARTLAAGDSLVFAIGSCQVTIA